MILFANKVAKAGDGVARVSHKLALGLRAVEFLAIDI